MRLFQVINCAFLFFTMHNNLILQTCLPIVQKVGKNFFEMHVILCQHWKKYIPIPIYEAFITFTHILSSHPTYENPTVYYLFLFRSFKTLEDMFALP